MTTGVSEHATGLWAIHGSLLELDHQLDATFLSWARQLKACLLYTSDAADE